MQKSLSPRSHLKLLSALWLAWKVLEILQKSKASRQKYSNCYSLKNAKILFMTSRLWEDSADSIILQLYAVCTLLWVSRTDHPVTDPDGEKVLFLDYLLLTWGTDQSCTLATTPTLLHVLTERRWMLKIDKTAGWSWKGALPQGFINVSLHANWVLRKEELPLVMAYFALQRSLPGSLSTSSHVSQDTCKVHGWKTKQKVCSTSATCCSVTLLGCLKSAPKTFLRICEWYFLSKFPLKLNKSHVRPASNFENFSCERLIFVPAAQMMRKSPVLRSFERQSCMSQALVTLDPPPLFNQSLCSQSSWCFVHVSVSAIRVNIWRKFASTLWKLLPGHSKKGRVLSSPAPLGSGSPIPWFTVKQRCLPLHNGKWSIFILWSKQPWEFFIFVIRWYQVRL